MHASRRWGAWYVSGFTGPDQYQAPFACRANAIGLLGRGPFSHFCTAGAGPALPLLDHWGGARATPHRELNRKQERFALPDSAVVVLPDQRFGRLATDVFTTGGK